MSLARVARPWRVLGAALFATLAACSTDAPTTAPNFAFTWTNTAEAGAVKVCYFGTPGTTAQFTTTIGGTTTNSEVLPNDGCDIVWTGTSEVTATIAMIPQAGLTVERIAVVGSLDGGSTVWNPNPAQVTVRADGTTGAAVWFKVVGTPVPPPAQGCTPGFWKNSVGSWVGYSPSASFYATFGITRPSSMPANLTLLGALDLGGGGRNALARHATAGLLNAAHPGVSYGMTTSQVISATQAAFAGGDIEGTKNNFDTMNNAGCPLSNDNAFGG